MRVRLGFPRLGAGRYYVSLDDRLGRMRSNQKARRGFSRRRFGLDGFGGFGYRMCRRGMVSRDRLAGRCDDFGLGDEVSFGL
jgi:hypothetical protein